MHCKHTTRLASIKQSYNCHSHTYRCLHTSLEQQKYAFYLLVLAQGVITVCILVEAHFTYRIVIVLNTLITHFKNAEVV